ncbi:hypothetical protein [Pseudoduganella sp. OTU4001]|uniref:hypothetical protein n=1 Tax=Pseudoduganella sp. OTU4001 TaxID=3043854 RepID=UPI00313A9216
MSNRTLIMRMESALAATRAGQSSAKALAETLRGNGKALEAMPYPLIRAIESLAMDLEIAQWHDDDGFTPPLDEVLQSVEAWLAQLPRCE